jgi:hypothetical protein
MNIMPFYIGLIIVFMGFDLYVSLVSRKGFISKEFFLFLAYNILKEGLSIEYYFIKKD